MKATHKPHPKNQSIKSSRTKVATTSLKIVLPILLIVILLIIASNIYYLGKQQGISQSTDKKLIVSPITVSPIIPTISTTQNSAELKTYTNKTYLFTIQYPRDFKTEEFMHEYDNIFELEISNKQTQGTTTPISNSMSINVNPGDKNSKRTDFYYGGYEWTKSVIELLSNTPNGTMKSHKYENVTKISDININGYIGVKYRAIPIQGTNTEGFSTMDIAIMKENKTFFISGSTKDTDELIFQKPYSEIFDKMISTFKPI